MGEHITPQRRLLIKVEVLQRLQRREMSTRDPQPCTRSLPIGDLPLHDSGQVLLGGTSLPPGRFSARCSHTRPIVGVLRTRDRYANVDAGQTELTAGEESAVTRDISRHILLLWQTTTISSPTKMR